MREVAVDAQTDLFVAEADPPGDLEEPPVRVESRPVVYDPLS
jgi:hypothetical protein